MLFVVNGRSQMADGRRQIGVQRSAPNPHRIRTLSIFLKQKRLYKKIKEGAEVRAETLPRGVPGCAWPGDPARLLNRDTAKNPHLRTFPQTAAEWRLAPILHPHFSSRKSALWPENGRGGTNESDEVHRQLFHLPCSALDAPARAKEKENTSGGLGEEKYSSVSVAPKERRQIDEWIGERSE